MKQISVMNMVDQKSTKKSCQYPKRVMFQLCLLPMDMRLTACANEVIFFFLLSIKVNYALIQLLGKIHLYQIHMLKGLSSLTLKKHSDNKVSVEYDFFNVLISIQVQFVTTIRDFLRLDQLKITGTRFI